MNIIELSNITKTFGSVMAVNDLSLSVPKGSIYGFIGPNGSGKTTTIRMIMKISYPDKGSLRIDGKELNGQRPESIGYLPEDRLNQGLFIEQSISNNIIVTILRKLLNRFGLVSKVKKEQSVRKWVEELTIKTPSVEAPAQSLSGGNQQRLVAAKWLATQPKVFILDGPTIGVDIASKSNIHKIIRDLAESGMGIIIISDEIPEILQNCNKVLVVSRGKIIKEISDVAGVTEEILFSIMSRKEFHEAV